METEARQKLIKECSQLYYSTGTSPLSDAQFDALLEEERKEIPDSPLLGVGHGYDILKDARAKQKFPHKYGIVGSLDKCHNYSELPKQFKQSGPKTASLKLDGLSCVMYYRNGVMYKALTRGQVVDGVSLGIDITEKVAQIAPDYLVIPDKQFTGAVRGEILMSYSNFGTYSKSHPEASNARNSAAGLIGKIGVDEDLEYLDIIVYNIIGHERPEGPINISQDSLTGKDPEISTRNAVELIWLLINFDPNNVVPCKSIEFNEESFMSTMEELKQEWYNKYPADGIVITMPNVIVDENNAVIHSAVAFKFKAESKETTITGIEWNLSKTKYLVPTLLVEPIELSGATVQRCAGCNAKMVEDNGWGIGAKVEMLRSGEVIPYIDRTIEPATPDIPTTCPVCGAELIRDGVHIKCPNPDCSDIQIQDLLVWCNNIAPIDGLGDTLKIKFFEEFGIKSIEDIYSQDVIVKRLLTREEGAQKSLFCQVIDKLTVICDSPNIPIISALKALNIPRLGDATAELLSHHPEDIKKLMNGEIPDNLAYKIGNANAESIIKHADKFKRLNYISRNLIFEDNSSNNSRIKVAITGSLSVPRKQFEQLLNNNGFTLGDITKDTKYLIADASSTSSKYTKALKLNIPIISEAEFRKKYNLL